MKTRRKAASILNTHFYIGGIGQVRKDEDTPRLDDEEEHGPEGFEEAAQPIGRGFMGLFHDHVAGYQGTHTEEDQGGEATSAPDLSN